MSDFAGERPRLVALATRILGSAVDADDIVQDAWLRLSHADDIDELPAWLTTVVTRLCLDQLRRRSTRTQAEAKASDPPEPADPEADALAAERVGDAMQVVLGALAPAERAAFVLHDVFGYSFEEIAVILGRSDSAVRQLASRGRRKARGLPESAASLTARSEHERVVHAFLAAARGGDMEKLLSLLAPDAVIRPDAAGRRMGTDAEYAGADAVAARFNGARGAAPVMIDGEPGAAWVHRGEVKVAFVFHVEAGMVREVKLIADPDVLATMNVVRARNMGR